MALFTLNLQGAQASFMLNLQKTKASFTLFLQGRRLPSTLDLRENEGFIYTELTGIRGLYLGFLTS